MDCALLAGHAPELRLPRARGLGGLSLCGHFHPCSPSRGRRLRLEEAEIQGLKSHMVGLRLCLGC